MKPKTTTREIGPLSLRASVSPSTLDEKKRTVEVVWTTGERVMRGFFEQFWEELSLDPAHVHLERLNGGAPLLDAHNSWSLGAVIGVVESAKIEKDKGTATVRFARAEDDPAADAIFRKVADGIIRNVSVGYRVNKLKKVEDEDGKIPVYRAVDWTPYEISMVPMGADAGAGVRSAGAEKNTVVIVEEKKKMAKVKKVPQGEGAEKTRAGTVTVHTDDDEILEDAEDDDTEEEMPSDEMASEDAEDDDEEERAASIRVGERKRIADIHRVAKTLDVPELAEQHVNAGTSADKFRAMALSSFEKKKKIETGQGGARIEAGADARDKWLRGAEAFLIARSGSADVVLADAKRRGENLRLDPGEFRGMSLVEIARQSLERNGIRTAGMSKHDLVGRALGMPGLSHRAGGYQSTSDFPVLLAATLNKVLLASYGTAPDTWTQFCATGSVSDFRASSRIRMGTFGRLDKVNEGGEFKNKVIPDGAAEPITAETFGNIIGITRQAIINDDLGAFTSFAARLGRAARLSIEVDVYALLALNAGLGPTMADGLTLFHATHANIGTGAALSVASIDADRVLMAAQTDPSGNEMLDLKPSVLLLAAGLGGAAKVLNMSQYDPTANLFQKPNAVVGLYTTVIDTGRLTGTRRYSFASPSIAPTIEVVFLDGVQTPFLDQQEGWRIDGVEWKVRLDYGLGAVDWRGAVTNAGV